MFIKSSNLSSVTASDITKASFILFCIISLGLDLSFVQARRENRCCCLLTDTVLLRGVSPNSCLLLVLKQH